MNPSNQRLCHPNLYRNGGDYSRWRVDCKTIFWDVLRRESPVSGKSNILLQKNVSYEQSTAEFLLRPESWWWCSRLFFSINWQINCTWAKRSSNRSILAWTVSLRYSGKKSWSGHNRSFPKPVVCRLYSRPRRHKRMDRNHRQSDDRLRIGCRDAHSKNQRDLDDWRRVHPDY